MKCEYCKYRFICFYEDKIGPCHGLMCPIAFGYCYDDNNDDGFGIHTCEAHQYMELKDAGEWWKGPRGYQK